MMPLAPCHQNFEQLQAHARDRLVRQVIADALNRVLAALDKMHLFLQLVPINKCGGDTARNSKGYSV